MVRRTGSLPVGNPTDKQTSARRTRPKIPPNSASPTSIQVQQKPSTPQYKDSFLKETAKKWLPTDNRTFMFSTVAAIYLVIAVVHYFETGDSSMLTTLLTGVGVYVGAKEIVKEVKKGKGDSDEEQSLDK